MGASKKSDAPTLKKIVQFILEMCTIRFCDYKLYNAFAFSKNCSDVREFGIAEKFTFIAMSFIAIIVVPVLSCRLFSFINVY